MCENTCVSTIRRKQSLHERVENRGLAPKRLNLVKIATYVGRFVVSSFAGAFFFDQDTEQEAEVDNASFCANCRSISKTLRSRLQAVGNVCAKSYAAAEHAICSRVGAGKPLERGASRAAKVASRVEGSQFSRLESTHHKQIHPNFLAD